MTSKSAEHRIGLVPCPLCKNIEYRRKDCKACVVNGTPIGMVPVDKAIEIGLCDTDPEMKPPSQP